MADQKSWEKSVKTVLKMWQSELKKTTTIGKKMLAASKINSELSTAYQQLGALVYKEIKAQRLSLENEKVEKLCKKIDLYLEDLENTESEVSNLKATKKSKNTQ